jgi:hypothetical protein
MKRFMSFFNLANVKRIVSVFMIGMALLLTTACNTGNLQADHPDNLPVQARGNNNPYKNGGDGSTDFKASPAPKANNQTENLRGDAGLGQPDFYRLVAGTEIKSNAPDLLYPGSNTTALLHESMKVTPLPREVVN